MVFPALVCSRQLSEIDGCKPKPLRNVGGAAQGCQGGQAAECPIQVYDQFIAGSIGRFQ